MNRKIPFTIFLIFVLILSSGLPCLAEDDDDHYERQWHQKGSDYEHEDEHHHGGRHRERERHGNEDHGESRLNPVNNPAYKEKCGACHFVYQPGLLPSASWMKIVAGLDDHFGERVELDDTSMKEITDYLKTNGAENSSAKRSVKIMRSVGQQVPLRITDIPYIREKHHGISPDALKRKPIGSLSNCSACHLTAESGNYDDKHVKIPR